MKSIPARRAELRELAPVQGPRKMTRTPVWFDSNEGTPKGPKLIEVSEETNYWRQNALRENSNAEPLSPSQSACHQNTTAGRLSEIGDFSNNKGS